MSKPLLDSLEINGYRCFDSLKIEKLSQVNLIVGKNNVGKTALLEAIWIYAQRGTMTSFIDLLAQRDEVSLLPVGTELRYFKDNLVSGFGNLFYKRPALDINSRVSFTVKSIGIPLSVSTTRLVNEDGHPTNDLSMFESIWRARPSGLIVISLLGEEDDKAQRAEFYSLEDGRSFLLEPPPKNIPSGFIRPRVLENDLLARLWDETVKEGLEEKALRFLNVIEPDINFINFIGTSNGNGTRYPIASSGGSSKRVALKSYGEGMSRLLGLSLALAQSQNGILLIDEIESGLHYSVLPDIWKLIFHTAKELNVQVFATTHSKDCLEAFAAASHEHKGDGMFIRLQRQGETIVAKSIEEERLALAVDHDVEVR